MEVSPFKTDIDRNFVQTGYLAKLKTNIASGVKALSTADYKPFEGIQAENYGNLFELKLELSRESQDAIRDRVTNPLKELAHKHGIKAIFAGGIDQPSHVVLDVGRFTNFNETEKEAALTAMTSTEPDKSNPLSKTRNLLRGMKLSMDTLVVAPNSYICSTNAGDNDGFAFKARRIFINVLKRFQPHEGDAKIGPHYDTGYYNILHSSVFKLTANEEDPKKLIAFMNEAYETVGKDLSTKPIALKVENVYLGRADAWAIDNSPQLLRREQNGFVKGTHE